MRTRLQSGVGKPVDYKGQASGGGGGGGVQRSRDHLYPQQERVQNRKRPDMTATTTREMVEHAKSDPQRSTAARRMDFDQHIKDGYEKNPRGLKNQGISRNHILADSNVASLVDKSLTKIGAETNPAKRGSMQTASENLLRTLGGGQESVDAFRGAQRGTQGQRLAHRDEAIDRASHGMANLRFDDSQRNTTILHGADYALDGNRLTTASSNIRGSVFSLARSGAISHQDAFDAMTPTIHHGTAEDGRKYGKYRTSADGDGAWGNMRAPDTFDTAKNTSGKLRRSNSMPTLRDVDRSEGQHSGQVLRGSNLEDSLKRKGEDGDAEVGRAAKRQRTTDGDGDVEMTDAARHG
jgi:hypothetical protein